MILSIKEDNLTVSIEFPETDEVKPSAADVLIGAYCRTDPDTMDLRPEEDTSSSTSNSSVTMTGKRTERTSEHLGTIREISVNAPLLGVYISVSFCTRSGKNPYL